MKEIKIETNRDAAVGAKNDMQVVANIEMVPKKPKRLVWTSEMIKWTLIDLMMLPSDVKSIRLRLLRTFDKFGSCIQSISGILKQ